MLLPVEFFLEGRDSSSRAGQVEIEDLEYITINIASTLSFI